ncbi:ABC transporter ATP-binding protein [Actinoplanes philippinensis]|uniref:ABC transporter ATP-binding protein n=1 Tax=Actinoplanes philippinensis TaxID=35752 RepID=UPI0033C1F214
MTGLLVASGVTRYYGRRRVLDGVDLAVAAGDRLGILGASGAGKSTLLRLLLAVEAPDAGDIRFRDRRVRPARPGTLGWFRRAVQLVPQDPYGSLSPRMTVAEIIAEPLECLRVAGDHRERVAEMLSAVGLDPALAGRRPSALSGGQRQRVAVARALAPRPEVLVADEPVSALDATVRVQVLDLLREASARTGAALIMVSHDVAAVRRVCTAVAVLDRGRIAESGTVTDVLDRPATDATRDLLAAVPRLPVGSG